MVAENNDFSRKDGVSLKQYIDELNEAQCRKCDTFRGMCSTNIEHRFTNLEQKIDTAIDAVKESTSLARIGMERRLETMNEFRDQLKDQASRFVTRQELTIALASLEEQIKASAKGRVSWGVAIAITALVAFSSSAIVLLITYSLR